MEEGSDTGRPDRVLLEAQRRGLITQTGLFMMRKQQESQQDLVVDWMYGNRKNRFSCYKKL